MAFDSPCGLVGVVEAPEGKPTPFILARIKCAESKEKFLLKCGEGISWEVAYFLFVFKVCKTYSFQKYCHTMSDMSLAGEGKLKHFKTEKKIIIYSR